MVRKLLKHDFIAILRVILPMQAIVLGIAVLTKILSLIPFKNELLNASIITLTISFFLTAFVSIVLTAVWVVVRFYKNLFTNEGYLTFTLPVSPIQHLFSKLLTSVSSILISAICVFISFIVLCYEKNMITDSIEILLIIFNRTYEKMYVLEFFILFIVSLISSLLLIFTCICLGQRFNKHRIIAAIGIYYGYGLVIQILGTIILSITAITGAIDNFIDYLSTVSPHILIIFAIVFEIGMSVLYFLICHNSISKHLNLE